jgi:hypothetical protein
MANNRKRLVTLYDGMDDSARASLLDFAEYLHQRAVASDEKAAISRHEPLDHPRPQNENVINAIKRLRASYFMLNTDQLLNETSALMAQFMMQGRDAVAVIDDLEAVFAKHYQKYLQS